MKLTHHHVRHLYWSICSQELAFVSGVDPLPQINEEEVKTWCEQLNRQPESLDTFIAEREHRLLGSYFEVLWQYFFSHYPQWQLLGSQVQIPPSGPTLGELDIVCEPPAGQPLHVELAIKLYLRHPNHSGLENSHWLGPRTNDRLDLKLNKLEQKQFQMLQHEATQNTLTSANLPNQLTPASVIKGYLFEPFSNSLFDDSLAETTATPIQKPRSANANCQTGHWIHNDKIHELLKHHNHWQIIEKWQWLGPLWQQNSPLDSPAVDTFVKQHFSQPLGHPNYALMLIALTPKGGSWIEQRRFMVVDSAWPYDNP